MLNLRFATRMAIVWLLTCQTALALEEQAPASVSPIVSAGSDAQTLRKAFRFERDPLVNNLFKDVSVEFVLRALAEKVNLRLIYLPENRDIAPNIVSPALEIISSPEEDPLIALQAEVDANAPPSSSSAGGNRDQQMILDLELKQMTVSEALARVLQLSGFAGIRVDNFLLIAPPQRVSQLNLSGPMGKAYTFNHPSMADSFVQQMQKIYTSRRLKPQPQLYFYAPSSSLLVFGTQEAIDIADAAVPLLDKPLSRVEIEVKLIELTKFASRELIYSHADSTETSYIEPFLDGSIGPRAPLDLERIIQFDSLKDYGAMKLVFEYRLDKMLKQGQARVRVNSKLALKHGVLATVDSVRHPDSTEAGRSVFPDSMSPKLDITPFIDTEKNRITFKLLPQKFYPGEPIKYHQGMGCSHSRSLETILIVDDGDSVIISGLFSQSPKQETPNAQILRMVPGLGNLFAPPPTPQSEFLILLTPHILEPS